MSADGGSMVATCSRSVDDPIGDSDLDDAAAALVHGRFARCEAMLACCRPSPEVALLGARLRRDQGWPAEAEVRARSAVALAGDPVASAVHAAILGDLGRDAEAHGVLSRLAVDEFATLAASPGWLPAAVALAELCRVADAIEVAPILGARLLAHADATAPSVGGSGWFGSVARALGLLAATEGDTDRAAAYLARALDVHVRAGTPLLVAHTQREWAAVLRCRGRRGDWEQAQDRLSEAEWIYRRLGVGAQANQARVVLNRGGDQVDLPGEVVLAPHSIGRWRFGSADRIEVVEAGAGAADLAVLVSRPGTLVHVEELISVTQSPPARDQSWEPCEIVHCDRLRAAEQEARGSGDRLGEALARAEHEQVTAAVARRPTLSGRDAALDAVTSRLRIAIDALERAQPDWGRHLRHTVAIGVLCGYQPMRPVTWLR